MCDFLKDTWEVNGNELDVFKEELKKLELHTHVKIIPMNKIHFLSISDVGTGYIAVPLHASNIWKKTKCSLSLKKHEIEKKVYEEKGYDVPTIEEAFANGLFMAIPDKKPGPSKIKEMILAGNYFPISEKAISTISNRISYAGNGFFSEHLIRDLAIAKKFDRPVPVSVVYRTDENGLNKVFAVMSDKYATISQRLIMEILDKVIEEAKRDLGEAECVSWTINHSLTRIYLEFPESANELKEYYGLPESVVPGLMIETSDIGDCSLRIRGYFRIVDNGTIAYMEEEYTQMHIGKIDTDEILNAAKNKIFPKYSVYPEKLAKLMMIDITTDDMNEMQKIKTMSSVYRKVSREIGLVKAIKKSREKVLIQQLIDTINTDINYTAYDVVMTFLSLSVCIETKDRTLVEAISKIAPKVMEYNFFPEEEPDLLVV